MKQLSALLLLVFVASTAAAEAVSIQGVHGLDNTHYHRVESDALDRGFHIIVGLPAGYDPAAETSYPTIYILDGGVLYPLLRGYYNYLRHSEEAPEAIMVAISYGASDFEDGNMRSTDYTAPSAERDYWGGAKTFQAFLSEQLLPFIESEYRSDPARRIIFGQSIGGQFILYTAQSKPDLFWGHIASNPALHRNLALFLELRGEPYSATSKPRLFVGSGSHDDPRFREPALEWIAHWSNQENPPWALRAVTLENHSHFSAPPASFRQGLRWIFEL